jgi:protein-S-isoprenylcysteine O-methyltransferase Ste14
LPLGGLLLGFLLEKFFPLTDQFAWLSAPAMRVASWFLLVAGVLLIVSSRSAMMRAGTNVSPLYPTIRLVETWPFSWSRNPMYLGGNMGCLGLGLVLGFNWMLLLFPILLAICHFGVVLREEEYLERKFGQPYADYKGRVRRWL